jgi:hypothetical protein
LALLPPQTEGSNAFTLAENNEEIVKSPEEWPRQRRFPARGGLESARINFLHTQRTH